jgi:hypothetical protein
MELFEPRLANSYIWACTDKKEKSFSPKMLYRATSDPTFDKLAVDHVQVSEAPVGRFDEAGRWCTYCAAIGSIHGGLPRYLLHPHAEATRQRILHPAR